MRKLALMIMLFAFGMSANARWFVQCTERNCNASTCQPEKFEGYYGCIPCSVVDKDHWCEQTTTSGEGLGSIIGGILSGIGYIVK